MTFAAGVGSNVTDQLDGERLVGLSAVIRAGGTLSDQVLLGGELIAWGRRRSDELLSRANMMFVTMFYPLAETAFFMKGGVGLAYVLTEETQGAVTTTAREYGIGASGALGFDLPVGRGLGITPVADIFYQAFEGENLQLLRPIGNSNVVVTVTIGLTLF
jgi:hypothetical protein